MEPTGRVASLQGGVNTLDAHGARAVVVRSFDDFYRDAYREIARALVLTTGSRELGLEAADEAMTRALARWDDVSGYANPAGWVYRVGLNWARSWLRRRKRERPGVYRDPAYEPADVPDPRLDAALAALPEKHRAVVVLRFYLDWSTDDVAAALGVPAGTVKSRLSRALEALARRLEVRR